MANTLLTPTKIAKEALFHLQNNLVMASNAYTRYKKEFVKIGDTVTVRKPVRFTVSDGATRSNQDVTEGSTTIVIDKRKHVSWKFTTQDLTLTIEQYSERYIEPAMIALANQLDMDGCALYDDLFFSTGTPGTTPNAFSMFGDSAEKLDLHAVPKDPRMRKMVLNPAAEWSMADALKGLFNANMVEQLVRKGLLGNLAGFQTYGDQNIKTHTVGAQGGTPLVDAASQTGATLNTDGWTASTNVLEVGDVFTVAGVNSVNPVSYADTGQLQQFVCTADETSDGSGDLTINIVPSITTSGALQTVTASPADNAAITVLGTASTAYPQNMYFHKNALALVTVPLELPPSVTFKSRVQHKGISMRVIRDYDIAADEDIIRVDIMYGWKTIYPELGGRLWG